MLQSHDAEPEADALLAASGKDPEVEFTEVLPSTGSPGAADRRPNINISDMFEDRDMCSEQKRVFFGWSECHTRIIFFFLGMISPLVFFHFSNRSGIPTAPLGTVDDLPYPGSLEQLRLDIAAISIDMMQEDTAEAASRTRMINIGPFCDLVEAALDKFGVRGVYIDLFETSKFIDAQRVVAKKRGLQGFKVTAYGASEEEGEQPWVEYHGIPNDREVYRANTTKDARRRLSGGIWWLRHYVGAITADTLLRAGSLLLDGRDGVDKKERLYGAASFMKELQRLERLEDSDIMVFHAQHGFIWHYLAAEMPLLDSYPLSVAEAFCGNLLWKDEYIEHVSNDMGRECRHGFGHGIFYILAVQETMGHEAYSVRQQFRPVSGYLMSEESLCKGYEICRGAPNAKTLDECKGAMRHSYKEVGEGDTFADGSDVKDYLNWLETECLAPIIGDSSLGPGMELYAGKEPNFIYSPNGQFRFGLDPDGDISVWNGDQKMWSGETCCTGSNVFVVMQGSDGNVVVYIKDSGTTALWSSQTNGHPGSVLRIEDDGQARIYDHQSNVLWETNAHTRLV